MTQSPTSPGASADDWAFRRASSPAGGLRRLSATVLSSIGQLYRLRSRPPDPMNQKFLGDYGHSRNRSASTACPPITPLRPNPPPREKRFLEAAEQGDKASLINFIREGIDVNCCDVLGRTALEIAVDNENIEIVEILLMEKGIKIGHALLYGIREGAYRIVEMLIDHNSLKSRGPYVLGGGWSKNLDKDEAMNFDYSADITPVMLAAHLNQFEILKLLKDRGATIEKPHSLSCSCDYCHTGRMEDNLRYSLVRIHSYRALASPAWISLTANDPVLEAFRLSWELQRLAFLEWEFREVYLRLSEQCKSFACDLLSQCRSSEEVIAILNKDTLTDLEAPVRPGMKLTLARLKLAIKYEQKQFVAHPHCQQLLTSIWYEGFPGRQERGSFMNIVICILLMLAWPLMSLAYILAPRSHVGQIVRSPFMKFLYYSTSFGTFLMLLSFVSLQNSNRSSPTDHWIIHQRGPMPSPVEWLVFFFVMGMIWAECKQLWDEGFSKYTSQWWNYLDFAMMCLYLCTFAVRAVAIYFSLSGTCKQQFPTGSAIKRKHWGSSEPMLVSEALFAVANVFSFARIVYLFQTNPYLGPLQISLGCMLLDIAKFFIIFFLILTSFAFGLHQLFWHYSGKIAWSSITKSYVTLLWALFGITQKEDALILPVNASTATGIVQVPREQAHYFTEWIGTGMYISYHVTSIVVLLNMLIAMMSFSFQRINENSDLEWKFHRSKLWMSYFDEGSSLASPFNIIVTPKSTFKVLRSLAECFKWCMAKQIVEDKNVKRNGTIRRPGYNKRKWERSRPTGFGDEVPTYREIMERLVHRYIHMMKKEMKMDGVNEDDLLEIKQDISSLRFELRDDRRREIIRWSSQLDGTKREIIRTLSIAPKDKPRFLAKRQTLREGSASPSLCDSDYHHSPSPISPCPSPTSFFTAQLETPTEGKRTQESDVSQAAHLGQDTLGVLPTKSKRLSSVSFKEAEDGDQPRQRRYGSERHHQRPPLGLGGPVVGPPTITITNSKAIGVQTEPTTAESARIDDRLRQDILRVLEQHAPHSGSAFSNLNLTQDDRPDLNRSASFQPQASPADLQRSFSRTMSTKNPNARWGPFNSASNKESII